ncbi:hypothetical protein BHE74_00043447, partial [Ensete ventricosum]
RLSRRERVPQAAAQLQGDRVPHSHRLAREGYKLKAARKEFTKTEDDLGQIIGEVLRPLDKERSSKKHFRVFFFMDLLELGRLLLARAIASSIDANFLK